MYTTLSFCNVPFTCENNVKYSSQSEQYNDIIAHAKITISNCKQIGTTIFNVNTNYANIQNCNYVTYINNKNKRYYAFIRGIEMINDNVTQITIAIDYWQSHMFNITIKKCFVEREINQNDNLYTAESFSFDDYVINKRDNSDNGNYGVLIGFITDLREWEVDEVGSIAGIPCGNIDYLCYQTREKVVHYLKTKDEHGRTDDIISLTAFPIDFLPAGYQEGQSFQLQYTTSDTIASKKIISVTPPTSLDGYTPKNGKLLMYPFRFMEITNNCGESVILRYEDFDSDIKFRLESTFCTNPTTRIVPLNYHNLSKAYEYSVTNASLPLLPFSNDVYNQYINQNRSGVALSLLSSALAVGGGILAKNVTAIGGGIYGALNTVSNLTSQQNVPNQTRGSLNSDLLNVQENRSQFTILHKTIRYEIAKVIDDYFTKYGYSCGRVKLLNFTNNHNYIKTNNFSCTGDIPFQAQKEIENMFNNGCHFWKSIGNFGNY